jgi:hypothetical protein
LALAAAALVTFGAAAQAASTAAEGGAADAGSSPDAVAPKRVVWLPEAVREQLRDELKREVLEQARQEGWAAPNALPAWTRRFTLTAELRLRWEMTFFQKGNAKTGDFPDFNAINAGNPFDVLGFDLTNDRYLDVDQNRMRLRLQARLGVGVDLGEGFDLVLQLASGDGNTPVSLNQTLGGAPGDFSKYQFWLERAALSFDPLKGKPSGVRFQLGRFANPFLRSDLVWSDKLNFDGLAVQGRLQLGPLGLSLTGGAFPYFVTGFNFPLEQPIKLPSFDKWLYAAQLGASLSQSGLFTARVAAGYFYFDRVEGRLGSPCDTNLAGFTCDSDLTRPGFAQKGNTYMALRTPSIAALTAEASGGAPEYQYFGLASLFRELNLTGRFELLAVPRLTLALDLELVRNLGFSTPRIAPRALNTLGPCDAAGNCPFVGGLNGYLARVSAGSPGPEKQLSWSFAVTYRHLESDAVVDAFVDNDFGLGGTNLKGYVLDGVFWLTDLVFTRVRWMSANAISGPPFAVDVLQLDVGARY